MPASEAMAAGFVGLAAPSSPKVYVASEAMAVDFAGLKHASSNAYFAGSTMLAGYAGSAASMGTMCAAGFAEKKITKHVQQSKKTMGLPFGNFSLVPMEDEVIESTETDIFGAAERQLIAAEAYWKGQLALKNDELASLHARISIMASSSSKTELGVLISEKAQLEESVKLLIMEILKVIEEAKVSNEAKMEFAVLLEGVEQINETLLRENEVLTTEIDQAKKTLLQVKERLTIEIKQAKNLQVRIDASLNAELLAKTEEHASLNAIYLAMKADAESLRKELGRLRGVNVALQAEVRQQLSVQLELQADIEKQQKAHLMVKDAEVKVGVLYEDYEDETVNIKIISEKDLKITEMEQTQIQLEAKMKSVQAKYLDVQAKNVTVLQEMEILKKTHAKDKAFFMEQQAELKKEIGMIGTVLQQEINTDAAVESMFAATDLDIACLQAKVKALEAKPVVLKSEIDLSYSLGKTMLKPTNQPDSQ